jgi:glycosyltransferase involved in cell wall biosynthesis
VREMNLWLKYVNEVKIVAPGSSEKVSAVESAYAFKQQIPNQLENRRFDGVNDAIQLVAIPSFDITSIKNSIRALLKIPKICYTIYKAMHWANHIHLRCPGNIGLLGALVQIAFPKKPKTIKYAGNWDPNSKQPLSYRFQKWLLGNTLLTKNARVLVYGNWPNQSKNIVPFFTASYNENDFKVVVPRDISVIKKKLLNQVEPLSSQDHSKTDTDAETTKLKFIYVGALTPGKQPLKSVQIVHQLKVRGYSIQMDMYGEGQERAIIERYIVKNNLDDVVFLHGNASKEVVKNAYQQSHFLLFLSKSEGWPKVVAEAMSWGCVPLTTAVSCVPYMLGNETRGKLVQPGNDSVANAVAFYNTHPNIYKEHAEAGMQWARQFTLEYFEAAIKKVMDVDNC